jgi:outer membrane protein OmpA-like peptidoglycan-associated protein
MSICGALLSACDPDKSFRIVVAVTGSQNEPVLAVGGALRKELIGADSGATISVMIVDGTGRKTPYQDVTPRRDDGKIDYDEGYRTKSFDTWLNGPFAQKLASARGSATESNVVKAWNAAADESPQAIIAITSGVNSSDPLDERLTGIPATDAGAAKIIHSLDEEHGLAHASRAQVYFEGVGATLPPQPTPPREALIGIRALLTQLCATAQAESCTIEPVPPYGNQPASTLRQPIVPFGKATASCTRTGTARAALPDQDLGFDLGSAILAPDSDKVLRPYAQALTTNPSSQATVTGYTSPEGSEAVNASLRQRRARAVGDTLGRLGAPAGNITVADAGPAPAGLSRSKYESWRRVDISIHFSSYQHCLDELQSLGVGN